MLYISLQIALPKIMIRQLLLLGIVLSFAFCAIGVGRADDLTTIDWYNSGYDSTKISRSTQKVVRIMAYLNAVKGDEICQGGVPVEPYEYENFRKLKRRATKAELIALTNFPNPAVRCYAFWALSLDHTIDLFPIVLDHIKDTAIVDCMSEAIPVGDFFIEVVKQYVDLDSKVLDYNEMLMLDSMLLYMPNNLLAKTKVIYSAEPKETIYPRIRELVTEDHYQEALVTLAKYQKEQDVELILNKLENGLYEESGFVILCQVIAEFPHPDFFPFLEENLQKAIKRSFYYKNQEFYKAIASYKNEEAAKLLKVPLTEVKNRLTRKTHINMIFNAIRIYDAPVYNELFRQLEKMIIF